MSSVSSVWKTLQKEALKVTSSNIKKIYKDKGLLVISKPCYVPVHSGPKVKISISDLLPGLEERYSIPAGQLQLAHRLDKHASGLLVLTYANDMAQHVAKAFHDRLIEKTYLAVLVGVPARRARGTLSANVDEVTVHNGRTQMSIVENQTPSSKAATTDFRILDNNNTTCSLCQFTARTGVKHQIRLHASQLLECPILGDHKYHNGASGPQMLPLRLMQLLRMRGVEQESGKSKIRPWQRALVPLHLFAYKLKMPLPDSKEYLTLEAPFPAFFQQTLEFCDLDPSRIEKEDAVLHSTPIKKRYSRRNVPSVVSPTPQDSRKMESIL